MHFAQVRTAPDVYRIRVPFDNYKLDSMNCYVVKDGEDALVVDTGAPADESRNYLCAALDELRVDPQRASFFLTHLHLDHAGLVDAVVGPEAPLYVNERDFRRIQPDEVQRRYEELYRALVAEGADADSARCSIESRKQFSHIIQKNHDVRFVHEGDGISVGRYLFRVVDTAGHTPGHQALYHPESGVLFSGDHILFVMSPGMGLFLPDGDSVQTYLDNLQKVRDLDVRLLCHSHGPLHDGVNERIDHLMSHQRKRAERALSLMRETPGATGFEITQRIGFKLPFVTWDEIPCVQRLTVMEIGAAFLRHLEKRGAVRHELDDDGVKRYWACK